MMRAASRLVASSRPSALTMLPRTARRGRHLSPALFGGERLVPLVVGEADVHRPPSEEQAGHHEHGRHHPQPSCARRSGPRCRSRSRETSPEVPPALRPARLPRGRGITLAPAAFFRRSGCGASVFVPRRALRVPGPGPVSAAAVLPLPLLPSSVSHPPLLPRRPASPRCLVPHTQLLAASGRTLSAPDSSATRTSSLSPSALAASSCLRAPRSSLRARRRPCAGRRSPASTAQAPPPARRIRRLPPRPCASRPPGPGPAPRAGRAGSVGSAARYLRCGAAIRPRPQAARRSWSPRAAGRRRCAGSPPTLVPTAAARRPAGRPGCAPHTQTGSSGGQTQRPSRSEMKRLTSRSSPEWNVMTTSLPPGESRRSVRLQRPPEPAQLVVDADPHGLEDPLGRVPAPLLPPDGGAHGLVEIGRNRVAAFAGRPPAPPAGPPHAARPRTRRAPGPARQRPPRSGTPRPIAPMLESIRMSSGPSLT